MMRLFFISKSFCFLLPLLGALCFGEVKDAAKADTAAATTVTNIPIEEVHVRLNGVSLYRESVDEHTMVIYAVMTNHPKYTSNYIGEFRMGIFNPDEKPEDEASENATASEVDLQAFDSFDVHPLPTPRYYRGILSEPREGVDDCIVKAEVIMRYAKRLVSDKAETLTLFSYQRLGDLPEAPDEVKKLRPETVFTTKDVLSAIEQLGAETYQERRLASRKLEGNFLAYRFLKGNMEHKDPEVKARVKELVASMPRPAWITVFHSEHDVPKALPSVEEKAVPEAKAE